ncbi:SPOR domain-containing protein [Methylobacterium planeticum]|uniref:SPOR domain-containing protein n=1 Tax=Methylobacterium planeticum TaxID=2615211 RepID=A0A6N6MUV3_9HYPH|nr:SPOR domain-containing protein [Methylobacterium planeticum]KAB1074243.1 SPOR domain-containing protein [Methylobacterium planeticum]
MTNASRATVDFEAFARELQQPHPQPAAGPRPVPQAPAPAGGQKADPLAELARIVGQDDPFRALLEARDGRRGGDGARAEQRRIEPSFGSEPAGTANHADGAYGAPTAQGEPGANQAQPAASGAGPSQGGYGANPADAFDQYLASVEREYPNEPAYAEGEAAQAPEAFQGRGLKRTGQRKRLVSVGAGLAVVAVSITGALTWRSLHSGHSGGGVPVIQADTSPLKIAPKTADGVEIPDQNKQIYEPKAKDGQIRIVNREEQPLDVAQAARMAQGSSNRGSEAGVTPGGATPQGGLSDAFGEPRRVRTVSVKPDTPAPAPQREAQAAETATPSPIPTMTLPGDEPAPAPRARPVRQAAALPAPVATPTAAAPAEATPVIAAPAPTRPKAPQRVASVAPDAVLPVEPPATTAATSASSAAVGGFSVQLGVRTSEREAQLAFKQMQAKHPQLAGQPELIRQAEVNGKTIFRVRVGPLGKTEATSLCSQLQGAGGQCFVAKN